MPSFRSAREQASHQVEMASAIGTAKPVSGSAWIHSQGTQRIYAVSIGLLVDWMQANRLGTDVRLIREDEALRWMNERSEQVGQKCLDNDRQAISKTLGFAFPRLRSNFESERRLAEQSRSYTDDQVDLIIKHQSAHNAFATRIARHAGLRAHELHTLRLASERIATAARDWSPDRFVGLDGVRYTVDGKGGLIREVKLPEVLACRLEGVRRERPVSVRDRDINYMSHYEVAGGNAWSKSFSEASVRALGYSSGAHGLRHSYAQQRLAQIQCHGFRYPDALGIVSQEVGHFRTDITEIYLR